MKIREQLIPLLVVVSILLAGCTEKRPSAPKKPKIPPSELNATLRQAALDGAIETARAALEQGALVDDPTPPHTDPSKPSTMSEGATALMLAAFNGNTELVELLLDKKANVNAADVAGRTPLMFGSSGPYDLTVELLLKRGAEVNVRDKVERFTALMFAAAEGNIAVVRVLLEHGADAEAVDVDGDTALSFARQKGHKEVAALLEKAAKKE